MRKVSREAGEQQAERADAVEVAVVALGAEPVEEFARVARRGAAQSTSSHAAVALSSRGVTRKGCWKRGPDMAAVDADDDAQLLAGRIFLEELAQRAAELMENGEVVPLRARRRRNGAGRRRAAARSGPARRRGGVEPMERLQPEQRKLDRVLALVRLGEEEALGSTAGERVDQVAGADRRGRAGVT